MKPVSVILAGQTHQHEHYPSTNGGSAKHVLIFPTWAGITDFERDIAARLNSSGCDATLIDFWCRYRSDDTAGSTKGNCALSE
jgi:dienelactone hydrolase